MKHQMTALPVFAVIALTALPVGVIAEEAVCGATPECQNKSSNLEFKHCIAQTAKVQDDELNVLYKKVRAVLRDYYDKAPTSAPKIWPEILKAQRAWLKFREAQCMGEFNIAQGGTAAGGWYSDCMCRVTMQRNDNLRYLLKAYGQQ